MRYRIKRVLNGKYVAQFKGWLFWHNMFCGSHSDLPDVFDTVEEAEKKIRETHRSQSKTLWVVKEFSID